MIQQLFVPIFVYANSGTKPIIISSEICKTESDAVNVLIDILVKDDYIPFYMYQDFLSDYSVDDYNDDGKSFGWLFNIARTEKEYAELIKKNINTVKELDEYCKEFGDSYFKYKWNIKITKYELIT
jgi:hypothetical protein